jgi:pimeloyl-ACP methyl ester carboxylesterase
MNTSSTVPPSGKGPSPSSRGARRGLSRRGFAGAAAATAFSVVGGSTASAASGEARTPRGAGSLTTSPRLPAGFATTFRSRFVRAGGLRQHVVIGGDGPPLLLVHGWPENWYAWRLLMPALARHFEVIAVDQRGIGLTDRPQSGYDSTTLAGDLVALMDALGHGRFAVAGHDTGFIIGYALAADHPQRVARVVLAEVPGPPSITATPPLFVPEAINKKLWHIPFNRADTVAEHLVRGREHFFFGYEFANQGGPPLPRQVIRYYVRLLRCDPDALRGSFAFYRAWDATLAQNEERRKRRLVMPVLAIGGAQSWGAQPGKAMQALADDVQTAVIPGAGHWVAEQAPERMLAALTAFLAPYRDGRR